MHLRPVDSQILFDTKFRLEREAYGDHTMVYYGLSNGRPVRLFETVDQRAPKWSHHNAITVTIEVHRSP